MSLRKALLAATMLALPVAAGAQPISGLYVGGGFGLNWMLDSDVDLSRVFGQDPDGTVRSRNGSASFDTGFVGLIYLGYGYGNGLRSEIELNYRQNEVDSVSGLGRSSSSVTSSGQPFSWGVMINGLYDFHIGWPIVPYVGVGVGMVAQNWDNVRQTDRGASGNFTHIVGTNYNFAYQAILGASYPIESVPGLSFTAEYRFVGAVEDDRDAYRYFSGSAPRYVGSADTQNYNHSVLVGLRYAFGTAPAPAVVPAAAPAPARTFLVFFDWDRATLTDRARSIIAEAATNAQRVGTTRIEVAGHADRSGSAQYNQGLSERRANAVAAELERRGIPRSQMVIQAFGETRPLVPTADGVREPQNRRVEIVLR